MQRVATYPFRLLARVLFTDFKVEHDESGLRLKSSGPAPLPAQDSKITFESMWAPDRTDLEMVRTELKEVLDESPNARRLCRHLYSIELALEGHGLRFVDHVHFDVRKRALAQLESLVDNWSGRGLVVLRAALTSNALAPSGTSIASPAVPSAAEPSGERAKAAEAQKAGFVLASDEFMDLAKMYEGLLSPEQIKAVKADFAPTNPPSMDGT